MQHTARSRNSSKSTALSETNPRESVYHSNDDIKKEIKDLECRIVAEQKRLREPFMKKERTEAVQYADDKAPRNNDEMK